MILILNNHYEMYFLLIPARQAIVFLCKVTAVGSIGKGLRASSLAFCSL